MALNPAYTQQTTRKLPFCIGWVYAQGDKVNSIIGPDGSTVEQYILGEGEWDSCVYISGIPGDPFIANLGTPLSTFPVGISRIYDPTKIDRLTWFHFHGGSYGTRGLPNNILSLGPDQGTDYYLTYFPSFEPALTYSGKAYYMLRRMITTTPLNPVGIFRSTRCRTFDTNGNVTGYGFTVNPTWQMIETLLRYWLKCQQPGLAGLTSAEQSCFDWPAIVAHAARNEAILANGRPRFVGNFAFAADAKLASMMEMQLRNCRSFKRERGGQVSFIGDDTRGSVFSVSQKHLVPGTIKLDKKDLSTAPNVYVAQYRDLEVPAICKVLTVAGTSTGSTFTTVGQQPFFSDDWFAYSGSADDADFAGDYRVAAYLQSNGTQQADSLIAPPIPNQFNAGFARWETTARARLAVTSVQSSRASRHDRPMASSTAHTRNRLVRSHPVFPRYRVRPKCSTTWGITRSIRRTAS